MRSIRQTFRRPQLIAPIIVFPTLLLAIQTGGAGGAVELPGFPPVQSFLQFMLAGAMMQSLMLAGNSGGIALAVDIEMGFTDRLFAAPIPALHDRPRPPRRDRGAGPVRRALVPGDRADLRRRDRERRRGGPDRDRPGHRDGDGGRRDRRRDRAAHRQRQRRPGALPAGPRRPLPLLRLLPAGTDDRAGEDDRRVQPAQLHRRRGPRADRSPGSTPPTRSRRCWRSRHRRWSGCCSAPAPCATGCGWADGSGDADPAWRANLATDRRPDGPGQERAAARARGGDPGRAGADDLLPRPQRRLRRADPAARLRHRRPTRASSCPVSMLQGAGFTGAAAGVNLARDIEQGWVDRLLVSPAPRWVLLAGTVLAASRAGADPGDLRAGHRPRAWARAGRESTAWRSPT